MLSIFQKCSYTALKIVYLIMLNSYNNHYNHTGSDHKHVPNQLNLFVFVCWTWCVALCVCVQMFRQVFEEGLELQKARLREQRAYAKEQRQEHARKHKDEIEAMENYYKDQVNTVSMAANSLLRKAWHWWSW